LNRKRVQAGLLKTDIKINGLTRSEIRIPAYISSEAKGYSGSAAVRSGIAGTTRPHRKKLTKS